MEEKCMTCGGKLGMLGGKAVPGGRSALSVYHV